MKRILVLALAALMTVGFCSQTEAQNKQLRKAQKKEYKTKLKQLKKEGWSLYGSSRSIDVVLLTHYDKLNELGANGSELMGEASKFKSKNVGKQSAVNNACVVYASEAGRHLKGRIVNDLFSNADDVDMEFDKFYAAYESLVEKDIQGELQESFTLIKDNGDGTYAMQVYFIVDEESACKARIRAMEMAAKESEAAQKYAKQVSDFVREGFVKE